MKDKTYVVSNPPEFNYEKLAEQLLPDIQSEIERHILAVSHLAGKLPPLELLNRAYFEHAIFISRHEKEDEIILRMLHYIQCLIVSTPPDENGYMELTDKLWDKFTSHIKKIYHNLNGYLILEGGKRKAEGHFADLDSEFFFSEAKLEWCFITGKRYINHLRAYLEPLLSPHDGIFRSLFGIGSVDFVVEIDKIIVALTAGVPEAFNRFKQLQQEIFLQYEQADCDVELNIPKYLEDEMRNACDKAFGLDLFDLSMVTNLPPNLLDALSLSPGEDNLFFSEGQFRGSPLRLLPIWNKPFLKVDGKYYCFNIYLLSDQIYRAVQKMLRQLQPDYSKLWNERQKAVSENLPFEIFEKLLPGAIFHKNIYYKWQSGQWAECDGLIIYDDHLFIIEIKAGAFTYTPPATDAIAYLTSIQELLFKPVEQGQRFLTYLNSADEICIYSDKNSKSLIGKITYQQFRQITLCAITIDQLTRLAAKFNQLKITMNEATVANVWNVSIDDLHVYADILQNPLQFLHFIEMRHKAFDIELGDELDHLGLYLQHNDYAKLKNSLTSEKNASILFGGYTKKIDSYYIELQKFSVDKSIAVELPQQELPSISLKILTLLVEIKKSGRAKAASILLGCDGETREQFAVQCYQSLKHTRKTQRLMPFHLRGIQIIVFCSYHYPDIDEHTEFIIHALASMRLTNEQENLLLELYFDEKDELLKVDFYFLTIQDVEEYGKDRVQEKMKELGNKRVQRRVQQGKIGRNELCPCGSGKKYKHCHL